jgi:Domain of Unknown Function (DUF928)
MKRSLLALMLFPAIAAVLLILPLSASASSIRFNRPKPPKTNPVAGPIVGSVGRGASLVCPATALPLVTLTPEQRVTNPNSIAPIIQVWGKMTAANPTLWFYMPYDKTSKLTASFTLNGITTPVTLPDKPGFIPVSVSSRPHLKLEVGQSYPWSLTVNCGVNPNVSGWIEWVEVEPQTLKLITAAKPKPTQQAILYANEGLWYDAVNILAIQRGQKPNNQEVNTLWQQLLANLSDPKAPRTQREATQKVVSQPIVQLPK